jgi:hypothetical protein
MATYILLRNNVESKSLSLEELQAMGLRSSDMVWVECQSWDWQRPHEIPELRSLLEGNAVPGKKTGATANREKETISSKPAQKIRASHTTMPDEAIIQTPIAIKEESVPENIATGPKDELVKPPVEETQKQEIIEELAEPVAEKPVEQAPAYKPAVILPKTEVEKPVPEIDPDLLKYSGIKSGVQSNEQPTSEQKGASKTEEVPTLQTNYSRSLDEIKELYVKNLAEQGRLNKTKKRAWLPNDLRKVAVYAGFAIAGAAAVFAFKGKGNKKGLAAAPVTQTAPVSQRQEPVTEPSGLEEQLDKRANEINNQPGLEEQRPMVDDIVRIAKEEPRQPEQVVTENKIVSREERKVEPAEIKKVAEEPKSKSEDGVTDLHALVSVKANDYTTGSFGGIRNLELTVQNDSRYLLDEVTVELKYLNLDNIMVNTEKLVFRSVQPGQPETIAVKKSRRGLKIKYRVTRIESREAGNSTASH